MALQRCRPPAAWLARFLACALPGRSLSRASPQDLALLLWCLATLRRRPPPGWAGRLVDAAAAKLRIFDGRQLGMALWALAVLQMSPGEGFLSAAVDRAHALLLPQSQEGMHPALQDNVQASFLQGGLVATHCSLQPAVQVGRGKARLGTAGGTVAGLSTPDGPPPDSDHGGSDQPHPPRDPGASRACWAAAALPCGAPVCSAGAPQAGPCVQQGCPGPPCRLPGPSDSTLGPSDSTATSHQALRLVAPAVKHNLDELHPSASSSERSSQQEGSSRSSSSRSEQSTGARSRPQGDLQSGFSAASLAQLCHALCAFNYTPGPGFRSAVMEAVVRQPRRSGSGTKVTPTTALSVEPNPASTSTNEGPRTNGSRPGQECGDCNGDGFGSLLSALGPQELMLVLMGLAHWGCRPEPNGLWISTVLRHSRQILLRPASVSTDGSSAARGSGNSSSSNSFESLAGTSWCLAQMGVHPPLDWMCDAEKKLVEMMMQLQRQGGRGSNGGGMNNGGEGSGLPSPLATARCLAALGALRYAPGPRLASALVHALCKQLPSVPAKHLFPAVLSIALLRLPIPSQRHMRALVLGPSLLQKYEHCHAHNLVQHARAVTAWWGAGVQPGWAVPLLRALDAQAGAGEGGAAVVAEAAENLRLLLNTTSPHEYDPPSE